MKIQLDIPKELNKKLKIEKLERDLNTLQELIILIIQERYKDD